MISQAQYSKAYSIYAIRFGILEYWNIVCDTWCTHVYSHHGSKLLHQTRYCASCISYNKGWNSSLTSVTECKFTNQCIHSVVMAAAVGGGTVDPCCDFHSIPEMRYGTDFIDS